MGAAARSLAVERYSWPDIARRLDERLRPRRGRGREEGSVKRRRASFATRGLAALVVLALLAGAIAGVWWRGPEWERRLPRVRLRRAGAGSPPALALNLLSVLARAISWHLTIGQALPDPQPAFRHVFSAFGVGLLGNAVLPARAGELARVAVLRRHLPHGPGTSATLLGTVFAHRLFDLFPVSLLVLYVLLTAKIPHWAVTSLIILGLVSIALFAVAMLSARRHGGPRPRRGTRTGALLAMARQGLAVMRAPVAAAAAIFFQTVGWALQLLAVWAVTAAFDMDVPLPAAAVVLLLMNVATIFPLWPGNIGLLQAAVALPLRRYGVPYGTGFAFGIVLQALEMSVGVGVGLVMLAREGLSFASLRKMEEDEEAEAEELLEVEEEKARQSRRGRSSRALPTTPRAAERSTPRCALRRCRASPHRRGELLAAPPELDRLVDGDVAALEPGDDLLQLRCWSSSKLRSARSRPDLLDPRASPPAASSTSIACPAATAGASRSTAPPARTIAYPRSSVALGDRPEPCGRPSSAARRRSKRSIGAARAAPAGAQALAAAVEEVAGSPRERGARPFEARRGARRDRGRRAGPPRWASMPDVCRQVAERRVLLVPDGRDHRHG